MTHKRLRFDEDYADELDARANDAPPPPPPEPEPPSFEEQIEASRAEADAALKRVDAAIAEMKERGEAIAAELKRISEHPPTAANPTPPPRKAWRFVVTRDPEGRHIVEAYPLWPSNSQ